MKKIIITFIFLLGILFFGCSPQVTIPNEPEVITDVLYRLTSTTDQSTVDFSFQDREGNGNPVIKVTGPLKPNTTYNGDITLLNEQNSKSEDITQEIKSEAVDHQFFYQTTLRNVVINYEDKDSGGSPIGLETSLTTGDKEQGKLTITLRHKPDKKASGVAQGNIAEAGGETDIEVSFDVTVE